MSPLDVLCVFQTGEICLNILKKEWSPAWSLQVNPSLRFYVLLLLRISTMISAKHVLRVLAIDLGT